MDSVACNKQNGSVQVNSNDVWTNKLLAPECVAPITPDTVKENGDLHSPLTLTPMDENSNDVFDPFAPAPHINMFDHKTESLSDEDMFESVYRNFLQLIVSKITEEGILAAAQLSNVVEYDLDDCKTPPPSSPLLREEPDTCPAAPIKVKLRRINIQLGLCKKLEF